VTVWEITGSTTDGEVKNNVEFLIEWGIVSSSNPWVVEGWWELSSLEEALLGEVNLEESVCWGISVNVGV
jgi:uncharacterized membrane protein